jgi:IS30 family transposase
VTVMTESDRRRIEELAEKGFKAGRISQLIGRHKSTVNWFMYCNGLCAPKKLEKPITYVRNGMRVHRFTDEEDTFIEALRIQSFSPEEIAKAAAARFGTERKHHSIRCRLKMLAARELAE